MYTRVYRSFNHECIKFTYNLEYSIFETVELSIVQYTTCIPRLLLTLNNTCVLPGSTLYDSSHTTWACCKISHATQST